ncbi:unnamed protein product [Phytophthora fragariaefolia]|uniref:Unnamed protein product n=1 Tax=Phytophthora fragariaefolia TaxID=1490495 RepID=A0A9W6XPZ1_9STRA|nr:unnamed protein product [Phytophthora fragariaefolia]
MNATPSTTSSRSSKSSVASLRGTCCAGAAAEQQRVGTGRGDRATGVQVPVAVAAAAADGVVVGSGRVRGVGDDTGNGGALSINTYALTDKPAWRDLTDTMVGAELNLDLPLDELEITSDEEGYKRYTPERSLPASLAEVEAVRSMRFEPELEMEVPCDLYVHTDNSTTTRLTKDAIFDGTDTSLDTVMSLRRFKLIHRCLSFRSEPGMSEERDPAARIRPLLNLLKCTGGRYVEVGRDLALDEARIASQSRHGRHLIVDNPQKPGG